ncbi:MAG: hypothetical protein ACI4CT_07435 [Lachnospiraceae bacterium]
MRKGFKRTLALMTAVAMAIPVCGMSAQAKTVSKVDLGTHVKAYYITDEQAAMLTDGDTDTTFTISRQAHGNPYVEYVVYDAGEGKTWDFNSIIVSGGGNVKFFASNSGDILTTDPSSDSDYTSNSYALFKSTYSMDYIGETSSSLLASSFEANPSDYRYLAVLPTSWPTVTVSEVSLYSTIYDDTLNEVLYYQDLDLVQGTSGDASNYPIKSVTNLSLLAPFGITS